MCKREFEFDAQDLGRSLSGFRLHVEFDAEGCKNSWVAFHDEDVKGWFRYGIERLWADMCETIAWAEYPDEMQELLHIEHRLQEQL